MSCRSVYTVSDKHLLHGGLGTRLRVLVSILCEFSSVGYVRQWVVFGHMCISWKE